MTIDTELLPVLAGLAHTEDSGYRCAMEHLAWVLGTEHTDFPKTSYDWASRLVQRANDTIAKNFGTPSADGTESIIPAEFAIRLMDLAWLTVGTGDVSRPYESDTFDWTQVEVFDQVDDILRNFRISPTMKKPATAHRMLDRVEVALRQTRELLGLTNERVTPMTGVLTLA